MSKHHQQQNKSHLTKREGSSISVDPQYPTQKQGQFEATGSSSGDGFVPSNEDIQRRAYQIHEEKGGSDFENWLEAERILKEERQTANR